MLRNNVDNKFSSTKMQSNNRTTIALIHNQLSLYSKKVSFKTKKLSVLHVSANIVVALVIIFKQIVNTLQ